jgi:pimeloyl-ACP methyl ester carboxylesterase
LYRAGSGEPIVLVHGFTGCWMHWHPLLADLAARYEVIAPAGAGHDGGPVFPANLPITTSNGADALEAQLGELGIDTAHFVGNSMGGALVLEMAKRGRARSVVALAPAGGWSVGDGEAKRVGRFFARQIRLARMSAPRLGTIMKRPASRRLALREVMRHGELMSPAEAVEFAAASLRCTVSQGTIQALREDSPQTVVGDLDRITCPVLLASPQFDRILPADRHAPRYRREIPGVEYRTLPDCGHVPMWDDARLITRMIVDFVDRHTATDEQASRTEGTPGNQAVVGA